MLDNDKLNIQNTIDESGCQVILVPGDEYLPGFAYTIGLHQQFNHPEIICFGLVLETMQILLNEIKNCIEEDKAFEAGKNYEGFLQKGFPITFIPVDKVFYPEYLGTAIEFYETEDFSCMQMIWPDKQKKFPWDKGFNKELENMQPLLDRNTDFFFYENRNLMVFTTPAVLDKSKEIKYVAHDEEGDWFFLEEEDIDYDTIITASLDQLTKIDPSINKIYYLEYGWEASRETIESNWTDMKSETE